MDSNKKRGTAENLVFSAIIALLGILAVLALQLEANAERNRDQRVLADRLKAADPAAAGLDPLPDGTRIYRWKKNSDVTYGVVVKAGDPGYSAMIAVAFSPGGEIETLAFVGSAESNHISSGDAFLQAFLGNAASGSREASPGITAEDPASDKAHAFLRDFSRKLRWASEIITRKGRGATS
jgi:hypothetical protein